jgi:hypothetical protein
MISGILGGGNSEAQAAQQAELAQARGALQAYRPEAMQARMNLFNNASSAYQGANNALETMYGGRAEPVGGLRGGLTAMEPRKTVMGHEMPQQPMAQPQGQPQPGPRRIGDGNGWEDTAARFIDPAGIFRGLF